MDEHAWCLVFLQGKVLTFDECHQAVDNCSLVFRDVASLLPDLVEAVKHRVVRYVVVQHVNLAKLRVLQTHVVCLFSFNQVKHHCKGKNDSKTENVDQVLEYTDDTVFNTGGTLLLHVFAGTGHGSLVLEVVKSTLAVV